MLCCRNNQKVAPKTPLGHILSTYQLRPSFHRLEDLNCFVDSLDDVDALPSPMPPSRLKSEIFHPERFQDIDQRAKTVPVELLRRPISNLLQYLLRGCQDDLSKIRAIYTWITNLSINNLKINKRNPSHNCVLYYLLRIKHRKGNYAQLLNLLCRHVNLSCIIIHGKLKGTAYEVGDHIDDEKHYGEWNAVLINNEWRFIDAYWGSCATMTNAHDTAGKVITVYSSDENYFLTDPEHMLNSHLPKVPEWQLVKEPLSDEEFENNAFLHDRCLNMNLTLHYPKTCIVHSEKGEIEIRFEMPKDKRVHLVFDFLLRNLCVPNSQFRYNPYVFLHKVHNILCIRIRSPDVCTFRFDLVGKDTSDGQDFDWITIYNLVFHAKKENCQPYPPRPDIGWGPDLATEINGLEPASHFGGEIRIKNKGAVEVIFRLSNVLDRNSVTLSGDLFQGKNKLSNYVVHRIENDHVVFYVNTPTSGEYTLNLSIKNLKNGRVNKFCSYLVTSVQRKTNSAFPGGFYDKLGERKQFSGWNLKALTHPTGFIETNNKDMVLEFENKLEITLSLNLSGVTIRPGMSKRLVTEEQEENTSRFRIRFPKNGNYGLKLIGNLGLGNTDLFTYIVKYKKKKTDNHARLEEKNVNSDQHNPADQNATTDQTKPHAEGKGVIQFDLALAELKSSKYENEADEEEREICRFRREVSDAIRKKTQKAIKKMLRKIKEHNLQPKLSKEVDMCNTALARLKQIAKLLKDVQNLEPNALDEIKGYHIPPPAVHKVLKATLLILGHNEKYSEKWSDIQEVLNKTGSESLKHRISTIKIEDIRPDVVQDARDLIRDIPLDLIQMVSSACTVFYAWVKEITKEEETIHTDEAEDDTSDRFSRSHTLYKRTTVSNGSKWTATNL